MNIKVFNIRLDKENCQNDQSRMNEFLNSVEVKLTSTNFVTTGTVDFWSAVVFYDLKKEKVVAFTEADLTSDEKRVYLALKEWRNKKSLQLNLPHYMICHNSELITVAKIKPETIYDFKKVKGFGELKTQKFAEDIIALLNAF